MPKVAPEEVFVHLFQKVAGVWGQRPQGLALDLRGRRAKEKGETEGNSPLNVRTRHQPAPLPGPKPQHLARFRKIGKPGFPIFRREADAQHPRWEAKRSCEMLLTLGQGPDRQQLPNRKRQLPVNFRAATLLQTVCGSP